MALGSFATATNVSPMPTARAPTPMRRNVPDDVPARCPPSEACACAVPGAPSHATEAITQARAPRRRPVLERLLKIHIELHPPLRPAVVGRVVDRAHAREIVEPGEIARIVLAVAPRQAPAAERVHDADRVVVEDVRAGEADVEPPRADVEPAVDLEVDRELCRCVERVRQPHGITG